MLETQSGDHLIEALRKYHNGMIESSQVIAEMIMVLKQAEALSDAWSQ